MIRRFLEWVQGAMPAKMVRMIDREFGDSVPEPYLVRIYLLPRNRWCGVFLHRFISSDREGLHSHPWPFWSMVLCGWIRERRFGGVTVRGPGHMMLRAPSTFHRMEVAPGPECWTLFIHGPRVSEWGFLPAGVEEEYLVVKDRAA